MSKAIQKFKLSIPELKAARSILKEILAKPILAHQFYIYEGEHAAVAIAMIDRIEEMKNWTIDYNTQMKWSKLYDYNPLLRAGYGNLSLDCLDAYSTARGIAASHCRGEFSADAEFDVTDTHGLDKFSFNRVAAEDVAIFALKRFFIRESTIRYVASCDNLSGSKYRPTHRQLAYKIFHMNLIENAVIEDVEANDEPDETETFDVIPADNSDEDDELIDEPESPAVKVNATAEEAIEMEATIEIKAASKTAALAMVQQVVSVEFKYSEEHNRYAHDKNRTVTYISNDGEILYGEVYRDGTFKRVSLRTNGDVWVDLEVDASGAESLTDAEIAKIRNALGLKIEDPAATTEEESTMENATIEIQMTVQPAAEETTTVITDAELVVKAAVPVNVAPMNEETATEGTSELRYTPSKGFSVNGDMFASLKGGIEDWLSYVICEGGRKELLM